jgi:hypothetical protein
VDVDVVVLVALVALVVAVALVSLADAAHLSSRLKSKQRAKINMCWRGVSCSTVDMVKVPYSYQEVVVGDKWGGY